MPGAGGTTAVPPILLVSHAFGALLTVTLAVYVGRNHGSEPIGRTFVLLLGSLTVWTAGSLARAYSLDPTVFVVLSTLQYVGISTAPAWFLLFALRYANRGDVLTRRRIAALLLPSAATVLAVATTLEHRGFYRQFEVVAVRGASVLYPVPGPLFWGFAVFAWGLLAIGSALLAWVALKRPVHYRLQTLFVLLGVAVTWSVNIVYILFQWPHPAVDPTPVGFAVTSVVLAFGIFSTRLLDLLPTDRAEIVDAIDDLVMVLDGDGRVVDANEAAQRAFGDGGALVGTAAATALPFDHTRVGTDGRQTRTVEVDGERRIYRARTLPLGSGSDLGVVLVLTDVTEEVRARRELERQNERLDEFASIVSHDLRSPLAVLDGRLDLAEQTGDPDHFEQCRTAVDRMESLVDDLLALARSGQDIDQMEPVDLGRLAVGCWQVVDADGVELVVSTERVVRADEGRLRQLLENLMRNSIEHGLPEDRASGDDGTTLTVTVGDLPDGFYVKDDGIGFPPGFSLDDGRTADADGIGLGLAIVVDIADAHGWEVTTGESEAGGARVAVTGVEVVEATRTNGSPVEGTTE